MRLLIHRGSKQIGGTCIEIESQGKRILLDIGMPLDADRDEAQAPDISGIREPDPSLLGIFLSHPHLDHYGLYNSVNNKEVPILIGQAGKNIIEAANRFMPRKYEFRRTILLSDRERVELGPFTLTPFLMDHSAYDAYSLLIEADGKRVFYSGDFRAHGRKGPLFEKMISHPPENIDVLLMEGTTLGRTGEENRYPTEAELEEQFVRVFKESPGLVLFWGSGQNIDRLVTVFRACRKAGREFIADMYAASVLEAVGNPKIPHKGFDGFHVYLPKSQKRPIIESQDFAFSQSFRSWRIFPEDIRRSPGKYVMVFRPNMRWELEKAGCLENPAVIYSMWPGYLEQERYGSFLNWVKEKAVPFHHIHTSGHAPLADLKRFASALNPRVLVPIHTFYPEDFSRHFQNVQMKADGEWWEVC